VIENYPEGQVEELPAMNNPEDASAGTRNVPFSREIYIERDDFLEDPPKKFFRLAPGREVRLRYAYFVTCTGVVKDAAGEIVELRCTYDPATRGGDAPDGRKVKGTLHWVSAPHALAAEVRLYETLFTVEDPMDVPEGRELTDTLNPASLEVVRGARARARARGRGARRVRAVRAARLFLRRSRRQAGGTGLEPRRHAARHVGEGEPRRRLTGAPTPAAALRFRRRAARARRSFAV
jgi:glutamyl/glutaminyl-tRNA synthetase